MQVAAMILGVLAAMLSYFVGWPVRRALVHHGVVDRPNARSSHSVPTARGGGLAILVGLLPLVAVAADADASATILMVLLGAASVVAAVSFVDDLRSLPAPVRFAVHVLAATAVSFTLTRAGSGIGGLADGMDAAIPGIALLLSAVWITGYANAFNFMDGINGLAAGQAAVTGAGMALLGGLALGDWVATPVVVSCVVAGAAAGFLPHNFPRARMFMGDVGSVTLGFLLAAVAVWLVKAGGTELIVPLVLLHANFVLDAGITLARRTLRRERFGEAHRDHFYQRLIRAGKSHAFVTTLQLALQALAIVLLALFVRSGDGARWSFAALVIAVWLGFFGYAEACFRRSRQAAQP